MDKIIYHDGTLEVFKSGVRRENFMRHFCRINTVSQFKATLRAGKHTRLGGYPLYLICDDGASLCFDCARKEAHQIMRSIKDNEHDGWRVIACDVNYEDCDISCAHCDAPIPCAYGAD